MFLLKQAVELNENEAPDVKNIISHPVLFPNMVTIKSIAVLLFVGTMLFVPISCKQSAGTDLVAPVSTRTLVSSSLIGDYSTAQLRSRFSGVSAPLQLFIRYSIKVYHLEYTTKNYGWEGHPCIWGTPDSYRGNRPTVA